MLLHPMPGYIVVELGRKFKNVTAETKAYEQANSGIFVDGEIPIGSRTSVKVGSRVFWTELRAGSPISTPGGLYCFVPVDAIEGYEVD